MSGELRNCKVVITGASAGVGRAAAHRFARAGARVGLIARDADALNDVKGELEELGGAGFVTSADVSNRMSSSQRQTPLCGNLNRSMCGSTMRWSPSFRPCGNVKSLSVIALLRTVSLLRPFELASLSPVAPPRNGALAIVHVH
ncbi:MULTISPECIES: SDR family NAD(P)-dependent oxidoreductase [Bradyrhizobium]|uniref:SDR family NAD(P)-dependent oxidoreductase n=1 Tax=Bradyrhizobium elkanii TaxID=29448 RepID=UPI0009B7DD68|nr:SDR family NAD(P)-dependent oxidoreductase [Bradyrhizobium elkanii]